MTALGIVVWTSVHITMAEARVPLRPKSVPIASGKAPSQTGGLPGAIAKPASKPTTKPALRSAAKPIDDAFEEARLCSLVVNGGSAELAVRTLVAQSRLNLVLLGGKGTPITANLRSVPLIQAVHHLCVLGGLTFVRMPHTLAIGPEDLLRKSYPAEWEAQYPAPIPAAIPTPPPVAAPVTRVVRLAHLGAIEAVATLDGLFKERGLVSIAAPKTTSPILGSVETSSTGANANQGLNSSAEGISRTVILSGSEDLVAAANTLLVSLDVPRPQVQIAVTMHDVSNAALKDLGISWTFNNVNVTERDDRSFLFGRFDRTSLGFNAVIRALETHDQARLIASPNVSVLDGERGFVLIGDRLVFPELIGYSQANTPIFSTKQERVGVYLQVSATVSPDGYVTMTIAPQVSTVRGYLDVGGTSYPQIATREAQSTLRIKSGETIVMGGLMRDDEIANMERIPILADLPVLGELFKRRKKQRTSSQLVISVTPTVVAP